MSEILAFGIGLTVAGVSIMCYGAYKNLRIAKSPCYVCGYAVGKIDRVITNGVWYHFACWVKSAREKVFGTTEL